MARRRNEHDDALVALMAVELQRAGVMEIGLVPASAFHLVGLVQLALRHPRLPPSSREIGHDFVAAARRHFEDCPAVRRVIDAGDDPREDRDIERPEADAPDR